MNCPAFPSLRLHKGVRGSPVRESAVAGTGSWKQSWLCRLMAPRSEEAPPGTALLHVLQEPSVEWLICSLRFADGETEALGQVNE